MRKGVFMLAIVILLFSTQAVLAEEQPNAPKPKINEFKAVEGRDPTAILEKRARKEDQHRRRIEAAESRKGASPPNSTQIKPSIIIDR